MTPKPECELPLLRPTMTTITPMARTRYTIVPDSCLERQGNCELPVSQPIYDPTSLATYGVNERGKHAATNRVNAGCGVGRTDGNQC